MALYYCAGTVPVPKASDRKYGQRTGKHPFAMRAVSLRPVRAHIRLINFVDVCFGNRELLSTVCGTSARSVLIFTASRMCGMIVASIESMRVAWYKPHVMITYTKFAPGCGLGHVQERMGAMFVRLWKTYATD